MRYKRAEFSFLFGVKGFPIRIALAVLNRWLHKERLPRRCGGGVSVAGQLEVAICATTFSDVTHTYLALLFLEALCQW